MTPPVTTPAMIADDAPGKSISCVWAISRPPLPSVGALNGGPSVGGPIGLGASGGSVVLVGTTGAEVGAEVQKMRKY